MSAPLTAGRSQLPITTTLPRTTETATPTVPTTTQPASTTPVVAKDAYGKSSGPVTTARAAVSTAPTAKTDAQAKAQLDSALTQARLGGTTARTAVTAPGVSSTTTAPLNAQSRTVMPNPPKAESARLGGVYSDAMKQAGVDFTQNTTAKITPDTMRSALDAVKKMPNGNTLEFINTFSNPDGGFKCKLASQNTANNAYAPMMEELGRVSSSGNKDNAVFATVQAQKMLAQFDPVKEAPLYKQLQDAFTHGRTGG